MCIYVFVFQNHILWTYSLYFRVNLKGIMFIPKKKSLEGSHSLIEIWGDICNLFYN